MTKKSDRSLNVNTTLTKRKLISILIRLHLSALSLLSYHLLFQAPFPPLSAAKALKCRSVKLIIEWTQICFFPGKNAVERFFRLLSRSAFSVLSPLISIFRQENTYSIRIRTKEYYLSPALPFYLFRHLHNQRSTRKNLSLFISQTGTIYVMRENI